MVALDIAVLALTVILFAIAASTLWWMVHAWQTPEILAATGFSGVPDEPALSFSLILPARHEETVLGHTLDRLLSVDHPRMQIVVVVGDDDPATAAIARSAAERFPRRVTVVTDRSSSKNKPKALNAALPCCAGDIIGVFDAEDDVHPQLLRYVDASFRRTGAAAVQGGVQLVNFRSGWFALRNCLEYFFYFRSRLHRHADRGFIPLGGNTVFVRRDVLLTIGGWDADCLAEDCELGVRLSAAGLTVAVAYDPHLVTREETPDTVSGLLRQRTRWNQGFLQVLRKGVWRQLPTRRQRLLARWTLAQPILMAVAGLGAPLAVLGVVWLRLPLAVALLTFLPALPTFGIVAFELAGLREFTRLYYVRARWTDYLVLVVTTPLYQLVLAAAAFRAVAREALGRRGWEKTAHAGTHLLTNLSAADLLCPSGGPAPVMTPALSTSAGGGG